jgi:thiol-disulfide isomerase/thioredoxin
MKKRTIRALVVILILIVLLVLAAAAYYYGRVVPLIRAGKQQGAYSSQAARLSVASFGFKTEDGTYQSISDLKGKVVVVDVWATWCGTCIFSIPQIVALHDKYLERPVEIIGLDVDDDGWVKVKPFLKKHPEMNYTIAVPSPAPSFLIQSLVDLSPLGKVSAIPTVFVVDRQGRLAGKFIETGHEKEVDDLVSRLLTE